MLEIVTCITARWQGFHRRSLLEVLDQQLTPPDRLWILDRPCEPWRFLRSPRSLLDSWQSPRQESNTRFVLTPVLPVHDQLAYRSKSLEDLNLAMLGPQLLRQLTPGSRRLLWLMHPCFMPYTRLPGWDGIIYDCYDEYIKAKNFLADPLIRQYERMLFQGAADLTLVSSPVVAERKQRYYTVRSPVQILPNLASEELFGPARKQALAVPAEFGQIPFPRLVYVGGIKPDLDQELLAVVAKTLPEVSLVLIGALEHGVELIPALQRSNVHWLGPRKYTDLPAYLQACQVGLIPYRDNDYVRSLSPNKASEYRLAGLEVVSVPIAALDALPSDGIHQSAQAADFVASIRTCLARYPHLPTDIDGLSRERQVAVLMNHLRQLEGKHENRSDSVV